MNQNCTREEIKGILNSDNVCYHLAQNVMFSSLLYKLNIKTHKNLISPVALSGCEIWSFILRDERRLWVFEYRVLRKVFRLMWDVVTGEWWKLRNEEFSGIYCSPNIVRVLKSRRMTWSRHVERMGNKRGV